MKTEIALSENNYIEKYSVMNCIKIFRKIDSPEVAAGFNVPTLANIKKNTDEDYTINYIMCWIVNLNDYLNISRKMGKYQIIETANFILQDYYYLKISDFHYLFSEIKKGGYGKFYESLDGLKIIRIFEKYANQRSKKLFEKGLREHDKLKHDNENRIGEMKINEIIKSNEKNNN